MKTTLTDVNEYGVEKCYPIISLKINNCLVFQVAYAQKDLKADIVIDIATLTGAQGVATGKLTL